MTEHFAGLLWKYPDMIIIDKEGIWVLQFLFFTIHVYPLSNIIV